MVSMRILPPQDAMFLWGETPDTKFHVASLTILTPPPDGGRHYLRDLEDELRTAPVESPWNLKLSHPKLLQHPLQSWVVDDKLDLDYHVRRSALASPGDERELGVLVSRLHSHQIDFTRPPWEMHVIEGLEGGRFAIYIKVHHALVDGYTGVQMFSRSMSADPDDRSIPFFFSLRQRRRPPANPEARGLAQQVAGSVNAAAGVVTGIANVGAKAAKAVAKLEFGKSDDLTNPHQAPDTILNAPTGRNRRFATQQYEIERLRRIARASGGTLNDVVLAVCGGGLRTFLLEQDALPDKPLIAFVPVNLREHGDDSAGGNKVGLILASMATDIADPRRQLRAVIRSTSSAKGQMRGFDQWAALAYSGYLLAPGAGQVLAAMAGLKHNPFPTAFNVVISNLPGPRETRYLRGSRIEAYYPVSIPIHGVALNITLLSYGDTINFGFVGCRDAVPSLQKLAVYTGQALDRLEAAYAEGSASKAGAKKATKAAAKKAPAKTTAKNVPTSKATASKATAKAASKAPSPKAPATKAPVAKAPTRKASAAKAAPPRAAAKKAAKQTATKAPAKKAAPTQPATKKAAKTTAKTTGPARKRA